MNLLLRNEVTTHLILEVEVHESVRMLIYFNIILVGVEAILLKKSALTGFELGPAGCFHASKARFDV